MTHSKSNLIGFLLKLKRYRIFCLLLLLFVFSCKPNINSNNNLPATPKNDNVAISNNNSKKEDVVKIESQVSEFVPSGWKVEDQQSGDLNNDSVPDLILQLGNNGDKKGDYNRSLIILFKSQDGKFTKAAEAKKLIRCSECGGMLGSGLSEIKVENGVLIIDTLYGSRDSVNYVLKFRYTPESKRFLLIGEDVENTDRAVGSIQTTSINYLTNKKIETKKQADEKTEKVLSTKESKISPQKKYIEEIDYQKY